MRVGTGHGDAQWAQQSGGVPFCVWGKPRPEVSRDSTAEAYRGECFGFSEPVRVGVYIPSLASGESVLLNLSFLSLRESICLAG